MRRFLRDQWLDSGMMLFWVLIILFILSIIYDYVL